jgi:hypothetical protein
MDSQQRKTGKAAMNYLLSVKNSVIYPPIRDGQIVRTQSICDIVTLPQLHARVMSKGGMVADCSQTSQVILQVALGRRLASYDVTTEWFLENLPHYHDPSEAFICGPVVWGNEPGHHMALVFARGINPIVFSHGHDPLEIIPFTIESIAQSGRPWTFTSVAKL